MVVRDFDVVGVTLAPGKTDSPLVVDPNAVLSLAVPVQLLQPIAGKDAENSKIIRCVEHVELPKRRAFDGAKLPAGLPMKEPLGLIAPEGFDHALSL
jgi:hypothetical protein